MWRAAIYSLHRSVCYGILWRVVNRRSLDSSIGAGAFPQPTDDLLGTTTGHRPPIANWRELKHRIGANMALEQELATFRANLPILNEHSGKFVLIHGDRIVDFFSAYDDAIKAGYQQFQLQPFLVKQIDTVEAIQHITRHVMPQSEHKAVSCHT